MNRLSIIGASYLQLPLIVCAKEMGLETHVFAWERDAVGKREADFFYPISITEKEKILKKCMELKICGICTIASDLASITVNYIAEQMGLVGNTMKCVRKSTNKYEMRTAFQRSGLPSPRVLFVRSEDSVPMIPFSFPLIVKPTDRSGSRGINKIYKMEEVKPAISYAIAESFEKKALIEEFAEGEEYSVEYLSWRGEHSFLTITKKYTTGAPHFVETGHLEPACFDDHMTKKIQDVTERGLEALGIENGASHTEIKIDSAGNIKLIEIGARMGGDLIGSDLVPLTTGFDYVKAVIEIAIGQKPAVNIKNGKCAAVRYIFDESGMKYMDRILKESPEIFVKQYVLNAGENEILDSSGRRGCFVIASNDREIVEDYMNA